MTAALKYDPAPNNYYDLVGRGRLLPLSRYDKIIVAYSGGKDCTAATVHLLEMGADPHKMELWHQHVDGVGDEQFMDWPCTERYVKAAGLGLNIPVRFQWKDKGFLGEMMRNNEKTKGVYFEDGDGVVQYCPPGANAKLGTRLLFPQTSADLSVRYCSPYLKIDVAKRAINNDPRFARARILFVTGERREESAARAKYEECEDHPSNSNSRRVDQWRAVIDWTESQVWDAFRRWRIVPHPAYLLGWGRVSCMCCIFGDPSQWASVRELLPERIQRIAALEQQFGKTIKKGLTVLQQADKGTSFVGSAPDHLKRLALSPHYPLGRFILPKGEEWCLPAGAFKRCGGPS